MKNLNRNIYLFIIIIAEVLFFTYTMVLYRGGIIDTSDLQMGCIYAGGIGVLAIALAFIKKSRFSIKKEDSNGVGSIEVQRTPEGTIYEVLTLLIIVGAWILALASDRFWIIEGFFSFLSPVLMFVLSILAIIFSWIVYLPSFKSKIRKHTNVEQVALEVRMCRVLAVEFALFVLVSALPLEDFSIVCIFIVGVAFIITIAIFRYLIYQARQNSADEFDNEPNEITNGFNINEVKLPRTTLSTLAEILIGVIVVTAWVMAVKNSLFTFDDGSFNPGTLIGQFSLTIPIFKLIWDTHRPASMREMGPLTNLKQVKLTANMCRTTAIVVAIAVLLFSFPCINKSNIIIWAIAGLFAVLAIVYFFFRGLIRRAE